MCEITSCCDISFINCELCTILSCWMLAHLTLNKEQNVLPEACNDYFNLFPPRWLCRTRSPGDGGEVQMMKTQNGHTHNYAVKR